MNIERNERGMSLIVKTVTRLTLGFILLYGIYVALNGHMAPGGGFAGGIIIGLAFVHIMLAFGKEAALKRLRSHMLRLVVSIAAVIFLCMVMINFTGLHAPLNNEIIIPLCEAIIVGFGLFAIFIALVLVSKADKDAE